MMSRGSLRTISSFGSRGSMMSRGHRSIDSIDSTSRFGMKGSDSIKIWSRNGSISSIRSISSRGSDAGEIDNPTAEEEKEEGPTQQETKEDSTRSAAAGLERIDVIKEYTRRLVERGALNSKTAEEELEKERRAHLETKVRLEKMEQEAEERRRELQYLQPRQSSWVTETIKLAAVGLGVLLRQFFVLVLSHGEYVPLY